MRWRHARRSTNVNDLRAAGGTRRLGFPASFGGSGRPRLQLPTGRGVRRGGMGIGGLILIGVVVLALGGDLGSLLQIVGGSQAPVPMDRSGSTFDQRPANDDAAQMVAAVLGDTEDTWHALFERLGTSYREPELTLFTGQVASACGWQSAAVGPFYCPGDQKIYLDTRFFDELARRLDAPGDFAQAYVIAHEVGHHVQNLLGISAEAERARRSLSGPAANQVSVMLELQADCLAGVWAYYTQTGEGVQIEAGDIDEALNAASAIGDDALQKRSQGFVVPDSFTHGTSAQRSHWFRAGYQSGRLEACDTFNAPT